MGLKLVGTDAAFTSSTSILLKTFISDSYTILAPAKADVNFDTKFERMDKRNHIIVDNMSKIIAAQILGATRWKYNEVKRIQIFCSGAGHESLHNAVEQHLEEIINGNVRGMTSSGISEIHITDFTPIVSEEQEESTAIPGIRTPASSRSQALITLKYAKYVS